MSTAGKLTERIAIEEWVETGDDGYGNETAEWIERSQEPAEFIHARGGETVMAARLQGRHVLVAVVRASSLTRAIAVDWRARDVRRGVIYNIRDVTPRPDMAWIDLLCESDPGAPA